MEDPMSSASIAQVHRATLCTGEDVVVKARHQNVEQLMHNDLQNLRILCDWIAWINKDYDFRQIVSEWIPAVKEELDLRNEARNLLEVRKNMAEAGIRVIVPNVPNPDLVKPDVLVMEYCQGFSVREVDMYEEKGVDKLTLLERICKSWAVQMHRNGLFNADPHPGNIHISTDPKQNGGDPSVPILLDFGLTRRFTDDIKVAFSRMIHACYVMDVDSLLRSFEQMGLKIKEKDPFQDISNIRTAMQTVPASEAKAARERRLKEYKAKEKANPRTKRPVEAWPGELVFFVRVIGLLKGLCSTMEVNYPYLKTTASVALETLRTAVDPDHRAKGLIYPDTLVKDGSLQKGMQRVIADLHKSSELIGMQIAAIHRGIFVADIAAGTVGIADPRPVKPDTLFNAFSVTKGISATLLHMAIQRYGVSYDDKVSKYWPGFEQNGKANCTLRHVLNHQSGLAGALPDIATLDEILDWNNMLEHLKKSEPTHVPGTKEEYHYMTFGYLVGGILQGITGKPMNELVTEWLVEPLDLGGELFLGLPSIVEDERLAVLHNGFLTSNEEGMLRAFGAERAPPSVSVPRWEKFKGSEHLYNPTTFNLRQVREACIPSANGHMSARALVKFYSALTTTAANSLMSLEPVLECIGKSNVERSSTYDAFAASGNDEAYALGYRVYRFKRERDDKLIHGFGHPGLGGSFAIVIPEEDFAVGLTTNYLSANRNARNAVMHHVCEYLGLSLVNHTS